MIMMMEMDLVLRVFNSKSRDYKKSGGRLSIIRFTNERHIMVLCLVLLQLDRVFHLSDRSFGYAHIGMWIEPYIYLFWIYRPLD